ncbi:MAG: DUF86 domain-containing protein [Bacteroidaceae bacterium]|nr:DUF86 domain-containing protein [Bacteroidaceae bacterium]
MHKVEYVLAALTKIEQTVERVIANSEQITSYNYYYLSPSGMERLESTCMLLIAIGESLKGIDKLTNKELLLRYPEVDWKGAMGIRDIIAHHYFDLDAEVVFNVVKNEFPDLLQTIRRMKNDLESSEEA